MQALREINWACWLSPLTLLVVLGQQAAGSERAPSVSAVVSQRAQPVLVRHSRNPIKQITIAVVDDFPAVEGVCSEKLRIALVGDSTVASYPNPPADRPDLTGWGQVLFEYLTDRATVSNHAASGRSSKSFLAEGRWQRVLDEKPDFVLIQFGHNDQPGKGPERETDPATTYPEQLKRYVREARAAGIRPILVTPVARRTFANGRHSTSLTPYADAMKRVAVETGTPVIDLHQASCDLFARLGDDGSANLSAAPSDRSHFSRQGGLAMARLVAERLPDVVPQLRDVIRRPESAPPAK